ncbi:hypothetical protein D3C86_1737200 [compost metagenome]
MRLPALSQQASFAPAGLLRTTLSAETGAGSAAMLSSGVFAPIVQMIWLSLRPLARCRRARMIRSCIVSWMSPVASALLRCVMIGMFARPGPLKPFLKPPA